MSADERVYFHLSAMGVDANHFGHRWQQVGRCVYCECGPRVRLYQGTIPEGHPTFTPPPKPNPANKMRERWAMDRRPVTPPEARP